MGRANQTSKKNGGTIVLTETYSYTAPAVTSETPSPASAQIAAKHLQMGSLNITYSYTYDGNGNIVSYSNGRFATTYEYDSANQHIKEEAVEKGIKGTRKLQKYLDYKQVSGIFYNSFLSATAELHCI